jgi:transposase
LAYVGGVEVWISLGSELRGRLWFNHFGRQSLFDVGHARWSIGRRADLQTTSLTGNLMSFDRLKRTQKRKRLLGHKLKPSRATLLIQNSKPHLSMKQTYYLGIDAAKHKIRVALSTGDERVLFEKDLPVNATGLRELLTTLNRQVNDPQQLLVLIEATGVLHLNWSAALSKAGYPVAVINPLIARRLYTLQNSIRDNKSDPIDARGLCTIGLLHGEKLLAHYRFCLKPEQFALQRLQSVRKALRSALTNLKKTYQNLLDLSFPELGHLLELDGVGIRQLLIQAPTPAAIAPMRLSTLKNNWMLRHKAAALKTLAGDSVADPELAAASAPALVALLQTIATLEARLKLLDQQIQQLTRTNVDPQTKALIETIPGFGLLNAAKVLAWLPIEILHSGSNRKVAARLQAFMGNDPRLRQSGQWKGHTKMSKRGVEMLRTAFFQSAFSAAHNDPELRSFYLRKRAQGKKHEVALSHLMRILTRRLVAVLRSGKPYQSNYPLTYRNAA